MASVVILSGLLTHDFHHGWLVFCQAAGHHVMQGKQAGPCNSLTFCGSACLICMPVRLQSTLRGRSQVPNVQPAGSVGERVTIVQAAEDIGELASRHAVDTEYDSPYAAEARKAGHDLPWWEKALKGTLTAGGFKPAQLTVRPF